MKHVWKQGVVALAIVGYGIAATLVGILPLAHHKRQWMQAHLTHHICRFGVWLLHIRIRGGRLARTLRGELIVANHLSYIDIIVIASQVPTLFVTSREVERSPFIGWMAKCGGSVFVDRRRNTKLHEEQSQLAALLSQGYNICLFPEATSSDGSTVLPFKGALIQVALQAGIAVLPVVLAYTVINEASADRETLDSVCYYGDMTFGAHLQRFLRLQSVECTQHILEHAPPCGTRKEFAAMLYQTIRGQYHTLTTAE
ncbi:lysophospholipid acyltransferase family protein [Chrysiogenes arsenatis]|uniref:lysophospholipid acyltransferase family protein n=1 Tax=Chrysiogenes arsenatis TaxID=309797 RepID=UPI0006865ABA|nr:lysophospholipid acyltransferase family protein [Chrysiogenes arsenatis]